MSTEAEPHDSTQPSSHGVKPWAWRGGGVWVSCLVEKGGSAHADQHIPESQVIGRWASICLGPRHPLTRRGSKPGSLNLGSPSSPEPQFSHLSNGDMVVCPLPSDDGWTQLGQNRATLLTISNNLKGISRPCP